MLEEDYDELMERFIKHTEEYCPEAFEWVMDSMGRNSMFEVNGENLKEEFEEIIEGL